MKRNGLLKLVSVCVLAAPAASAESERYEYHRKFFEPSEDVVTPHIPWAKPYARGTVRALFITHRNAMREVIEIAQRLSMDYKVFAAETDKQLGLADQDKWWKLTMKGTTTTELAERLRNNLKGDYDVIVIAGVNWDILPLDIQFAILKKVKEGAGLAGFVRSGTKPYLERVLRRKDKAGDPLESVLGGVPFQSLPAFTSVADSSSMLKRHIRYAHFGDGRVLLFRGIRVPKFQGLVPQAQDDAFGIRMLDYDYYLSFAIKAILWAAKKEAAVRVSASSPSLKADRDSAEARRIRFQLHADKPVGNVNLKFVLRDSGNNILHTEARKSALASKKQEIDFAFPPVPAGEFFADLWVMQGQQITGWGSVSLLVPSTSRIKELALARESFKAEEAITGTVSLEGARAGQHLRVEHTDNHGRLLATSDFSLKKDQRAVTFSQKGIRTLSVLQTLSASLMTGNELIETEKILVPVSDFFPDREDVRFVMWQNLSYQNYCSRYVAKEFYRYGIDTQYTGFSQWASRENLWHLPYAIRFTDKKTDGYNPNRGRAKDDLIRDPCLTEPAYRATVKATLVRRAKQAAPFSTNDFSLGDECHFVSGRHDLCFSATCIASFRDYVKKEYGNDLAKLNGEYGTAYKAWDEVMPGKFEDAQKSGKPAAWVDHRLHMESVWAEIHAFGRETIKEIVPSARVGYEGSDVRIDSFRAADHYKLMKAMDLNNIYFRRYIVDAVRDFGGPGMLFGGGWTGGYPSNMNEPYMRWFPWMTLFRGANSSTCPPKPWRRRMAYANDPDFAA